MRRKKMKRKRLITISGLLVCAVLTSCSPSREEWFEQEMKIGPIYGGNIYAPFSICAKDSSIMLVATTCYSLAKEISKYNNIRIDSAGLLVYDAAKNDEPLLVSPKYYQESKKSCIRFDAKMDSVYRNGGVVELLDIYCEWLGGIPYFTKGEMYWLEDTDGRAQSMNMGYEMKRSMDLGYIVYLLRRHDIYIAYWWLDEDLIDLTTIATLISNCDQIKEFLESPPLDIEP